MYTAMYVLTYIHMYFDTYLHIVASRQLRASSRTYKPIYTTT